MRDGPRLGVDCVEGPPEDRGGGVSGYKVDVDGALVRFSV